MGKKSALGVILMADDDEEDCMLVKDALAESKHNHDFHCVEDGCELMDYLRRRGKYSDPDQSPFPNLILLDLNMPRKDGRETLKEIKSDPRLKFVPIVVLTTSQSEKDIEYCYSLSASSFIIKPTNFEGLVKAMGRLSSYWFELVTLPSREPCGLEDPLFQK